MRLSRPFEVITPTLDGDVLTVLGRADGPFSGRQVQRLSGGGSVAGIRKALHRLVDQGIVLRQRVGNTDLYSLNPHHIATDAVKAIARLPDTAFELMRRELAAWQPCPIYAAVFGSVARREETPRSDIDVILLRPHDVDAENWNRAVSRFAETVSGATGSEVNVLDLTTEELWAPGNEALRADVRRDAITLMGDLDEPRTGPR